MKKALSLALILIMAISCGVLPYSYAAKEGKTIGEYNKGDIIEFGYYPQTNIPIRSTVSLLNSLAAKKGWTYFPYLNGAGTDKYDGSAKPYNYMRYCDIELAGEKYRGIRISKYRPDYSNYQVVTEDGGTNQYNNGYLSGFNFWFKYEPVKWRVLNPETGLLMCESIIDSQPFSDKNIKIDDEFLIEKDSEYYANNYYESYVRSWLNTDFYNTAFADDEKALINITERENVAYKSEYNCSNTVDFVSLPAYSDAILMSEDVLKAMGTDYSQIQGLAVERNFVNGENDFSAPWLLRSAGDNSNNICYVASQGKSVSFGDVNFTGYGIRPIINVKNDAVFKCYHQYEVTVDTNATCTTDGKAKRICSQCGETDYIVISAMGHIDDNQDFLCDICQSIVNENEYINKLLSNIKITVPGDNRVDYKSDVTIRVKAENVPEGYELTVFSNGKKLANIKPDQNEICSADIDLGIITERSDITAAIIRNGKVPIYNDKALQESFTVNVNVSLWLRIKSFILGLFGRYNKVILK